MILLGRVWWRMIAPFGLWNTVAWQGVKFEKCWYVFGVHDCAGVILEMDTYDHIYYYLITFWNIGRLSAAFNSFIIAMYE